MLKAVIVGAGLSGATAARLLLDAGWEVDVFEQKEVASGSCLDHRDSVTGNMVHDYGPHAFHTDCEKVWRFVNRFDTFLPFALQVHADLGAGRAIPLPFNEISRRMVGDWSIELIIETVFKTYSKKMWGARWENLPASITARVPKQRYSSDTRYHLDRFQGIPMSGFRKWIEAMLEGAKVVLSCTEKDWRQAKRDLLVFTGNSCDYFGLPSLPWRSLDFNFTYEKQSPYIQLNSCHAGDKWHRQVDHSYWPNSKPRQSEQTSGQSVICREQAMPYIKGQNDPFYPEPHKASGRDSEIRQRCKAEKDTLFIGRLATYRYINMDEAISIATLRVKNFIK